MVRPPKANVTMTEKLELRMTSQQKEAVKLALANAGTAGTATVARDLLLRAAADILAVDAGRMTPDEAGRRYASYIDSLIGVSATMGGEVDLPGSSMKMETKHEE